MGIFKQAILNEKEDILPYFYFLAETKCIGIKTYQRMQSYFGSPKMLFEAPVSRIEKTGIFSKSQIEKIVRCRNTFKPDMMYENIRKAGISVIPYDAPEYPIKLKEIKDPPAVLFLKGKMPLAEFPCVSVIGARECSRYGANVAARLGELFAATDIALISGMARGVDSISQKACIDSGGYSLAFLGGGVDICYPKEARPLYNGLCEKGGLLSEFAPGTANEPHFFALRNRLISGFSDVVCVVEAREKSGTMITVECALDQGKDVYAVPGRITDSTSVGTNDLIRQGACIITDLDAFCDEIVNNFSLKGGRTANKTVKEIVSVPLTRGEEAVVANMDENSFTAEQLSDFTSLPAYELLTICLSLTTKGILTSMGGGRFTPTPYGIELRNHMIVTI